LTFRIFADKIFAQKMDQEEKVLDKQQWKLEAEGVIQDISSGLKTATVSSILPISDCSIYINIETLEGDTFCIELSTMGFTVVGKEFDTKDISERKYYETPYSILDSLSPLYRANFYQRLSDKLEDVQRDEEQSN
jgi:hypothetical protein